MSLIEQGFTKLLAIWAGVLNKHAIAADYWLRYAALNPKDPKCLASAAHHFAALDRGPEAEELLRAAIQRDAQFVPALFNLAFLLQKRQQHDTALDYFNRCLAANDNTDRAHYGKALSLMALERYAEAKQSLQRAIDLQPMSPYGYYQLATLYHRTGEEKSCIKTVKHLSTFEPALAVQLQKEIGVNAGVVDPMDYYRK